MVSYRLPAALCARRDQEKFAVAQVDNMGCVEMGCHALNVTDAQDVPMRHLNATLRAHVFQVKIAGCDFVEFSKWDGIICLSPEPG